MDNGLIFPYPRVCVPDEAGETNHPKRVRGLRIPGVVERGT